MNSIDKEIEEFKNNLITVDKLSKELDSNNSKLVSALNDVVEIEEIKQGLAEEIKNLKEVNGENLKKIEKSNQTVEKSYSEISKFVTEMKDDIEVTLNSATKIENEIEELKESISNKVSIIFYLTIFNIIVLLLILGVMFI